ncbi:hypothetical protein KKB44_06710, partial [Candidatus Micrarchaeota archaeon]|nr:hypothetical protein [Candidatus Micrarchaeota archaeon]
MRSIWLSLLVVCALLSVLAAAGCGEECPAGQQMCGSTCLNVATDHDNCGGCGNACGPTQTCQANQCTCPGGQQPCGQQCVAGVEICNNLDDNCNSQIDEGVAPQSCNNPCGAGTQTCTNGTWGACSAPTPSEEVCDTRDNDCDGQVDEGVTNTFYPDGDNDHFGAVGGTPQQACSAPAGHVEDNTDCDDANGAINPSATEICDGLDNNCNDAIDEGLGGACACVPPATQNCGAGDDVGVCEFGTQTCADIGSGPQWGDCIGGVRPVEEICDGLDNDCDGQTDEGMTPDTYEANNSCSAARGPLQVDEAGETLVIDGTLYSSDGSQDQDWFLVKAQEGFHALCGV